MDKKIIKLLKSYDITDLEMQDMINLAPILEVTTAKEFVANCDLLVTYGYPRSDLDFLFLANPNIFAMSAKDLDVELRDLKDKYKDIESVLKEDPTII